MNLGLIVGILLILVFVWVIISGIRNGDATISQMFGSVICIFVLIWLTKGCVPISKESYEEQIVSNVEGFQHDAIQFQKAIENSFNYYEKGNVVYSKEEVNTILTDILNIQDTLKNLEESQREIKKMKIPDEYNSAHTDLEIATRYLVLAAKAISLFKETNDPESLNKAHEYLNQYSANIETAVIEFKKVNDIDIIKK
ncbi:hypothetical protein CN912_10660 [Bacillus cereus]|uniref:hypothetical protein n=1 Tax=Bacillus cereus group TaxID=86661 RepID=UPI000B4333F5|nr:MULTISPECIES: hypothetical protein [Bacillus cereus group]OTX88530.1 hypothetical protein BK726_14470 [Bacillus thuringiensis serovar londrina]PEB96053.1 hypothetical protein CON04_27030 [Bacillus cereus]PEC25361.1 hypothetical protein CON75_23925 [Bacillus thuringiensis]PEQ74638.1 hypothetical protein CN478_21175 [Bacillus cereus]PFV15883.1 hypothetical protein COK96_24795 [Bacillus cereus]